MGNRLAYWRKRPEQLIRKLEKAEKKLLAEVKDESGQLARRFQRELEKRIKPAKVVSKQDSPNGKEFKPPQIKPFRTLLQVKSESAKIVMQLRSHWVGARSKAVEGVMNFLGRRQELFRTGLLLDDKKPLNIRARNFNGNWRFHPFAGNYRLFLWAFRTDKGSQWRRHVFQLDGPALLALVLNPILRQNKKRILTTWKKLLKRWKESI